MPWAPMLLALGAVLLLIAVLVAIRLNESAVLDDFTGEVDPEP